MVGQTRGMPEGFGRESGSGSQQPPPPPSNLAELMAMQTELLRQLVQGQQNQPRQQHGGRDAQPAGYQEFLVPILHFSTELMTHWMPMLGSVQSIPSLLC